MFKYAVLHSHFNEKKKHFYRNLFKIVVLQLFPMSATISIHRGQRSATELTIEGHTFMS